MSNFNVFCKLKNNPDRFDELLFTLKIICSNWERKEEFRFWVELCGIVVRDAKNSTEFYNWAARACVFRSVLGSLERQPSARATSERPAGNPLSVSSAQKAFENRKWHFWEIFWLTIKKSNVINIFVKAMNPQSFPIRRHEREFWRWLKLKKRIGDKWKCDGVAAA